MSFASSSARIGSLVDPEMIQMDRINAESLSQVIAAMETPDARRFDRELRAFGQDGQASEFLLGVLAVAAGRSCGRSRQARVFDIQSNVVGLVFEGRVAEPSIDED